MVSANIDVFSFEWIVRRSVVIALGYFLLFLEACFLRNSEVNMS